jgi:hypothetical protein
MRKKCLTHAISRSRTLIPKDRRREGRRNDGVEEGGLSSKVLVVNRKREGKARTTDSEESHVELDLIITHPIATKGEGHNHWGRRSNDGRVVA